MKRFDFNQGGGVFVEFRQNSIQVMRGETAWQHALELDDAGRLAAGNRTGVISGLKEFLSRQGVSSRARAYCAIGGRGVSFRKLTLPLTAKTEVSGMLSMQIESEFPLSPDLLSWGYVPVTTNRSLSESNKQQEYLVAALKKEIISEYSELLKESGLSPVFTLAALARAALVPSISSPFAILDVGNKQSELTLFENGLPTSSRIVTWGAENISAVSETLAGNLKELGVLRSLYLSGPACRDSGTVAQIARLVGRGMECSSLEPVSDKMGSAAIAGLKRGLEGKQEFPFLTLSTGEPEGPVNMANPEVRKWALIAGVVLLACLLLPYAESLLLKPRLAKKLAEVKASQGQLEVIDRELEFFQSLKTNQPPYLDALFVMADSAPQGSRLETLSMNRRGEVSLRGSMRDGDQVAQFRNKLVGSGFFSSVVVEEQVPTPDRQKMNLRITAQWKPLNSRENLKLGPTAAEIEKIKATAKELAGVVPGGGGPPPGFPPPGMSMPPNIRPPSTPMPSGVSTNSTRTRPVQGGSPSLPPGVIIRSSNPQ